MTINKVLTYGTQTVLWKSAHIYIQIILLVIEVK